MRKKIFLIFCIVLNLNPVFAFKYSEADKDMFYTSFLEGYFSEFEKSIEKLNISQDKKIMFMEAVKQRTSRYDLINSSWNCIEKYPISQIVEASVECTSEWSQKQLEENKDLFDLLK